MLIVGTFILFLAMEIGSCRYLGTSVGNLTTNAHSVNGEVYIIDKKRLYLVNFNYDGSAPDAVFYAGMIGVSSTQPSGNGSQIPDEKGQTSKLSRYTNKTIVLTLPVRYETNQIEWLSVWCRQLSMDLGSLIFSANVSIPREHSIGALSTLAHHVAGNVTVLNSRQFKLEHFSYDGAAPDVFFLVGAGTTPSANGTKVSDEHGVVSKSLGTYSNATITITLPGTLTVFDIGYLSVYCISYGHDFGHVMIPSGLAVPPYMNVTNTVDAAPRPRPTILPRPTIPSRPIPRRPL